jgi:hypothetical protein
MPDNFINQSQLEGAAAVACSELLGIRLGFMERIKANIKATHTPNSSAKTKSMPTKPPGSHFQSGSELKLSRIAAKA